jgi:hypothetical protein
MQSRVDAGRSTQTVIPIQHFAMFSPYLDGNAGATSLEFRLSDPFTESASLLRAWLTWLGLHFNPFQPLDASADARLSDYLVEHHILATIWGDWHSFVFAPAGGGKPRCECARRNCAGWVKPPITLSPFRISHLF